MCADPATLALTASIASGVIGAASAYQGAQAQRASYNAQAQAAEVNARTADQQAVRAQERGDREAERIGAQVADTRGKQRAALAAGGLDLTFGTAKALQDTNDYYGMQDIATVNQNATEESYSFRQDAANKRADAGFSRSSASSVNPWLATGSSLLSSAGKTADRWYTYKKG